MPRPTRVEIGCPVEELDTPALCIDLDVLEANIRKMAGLCEQHGKHWRPHSKGHKSPQIARMQVEAGALGVTCAKLGEAEVMAEGGIRDLLIANQIVGPRKLERLLQLSQVADPIVAVDDEAQVDALAEAAAEFGARPRVLIEVDVGMQRAGVSPGKTSLRLAQRIERWPALRMAGLMGYEGHLLTLPDPQQKEQQIHACMAELTATRDRLLAAGIDCPIISAGGTGSWKYTIRADAVTELQAGGLIFMDAFYRQVCQVEEFDFALTLLTTVVSRPAPDRAIIDAGQKTHHAALCAPIFLDRESLELVQLSAEHGKLNVGPDDRDLRVGDRLTLIPGYSDFTSFLHNEFYATRGGRLEAIWPLEARGRLQ